MWTVDDEEDMDIDDSFNEKDGQVDLKIKDYIIRGDSDTADNREENGEQNYNPDGVVSTSSDFSV